MEEFYFDLHSTSLTIDRENPIVNPKRISKTISVINAGVTE